tara:strand:- start:679 stop:1452 length:774 start_codon:yes stop_codon:yes gene_type:complete
MARGRELSQLGSLIEVEDSTKNIGVGIATPSQKIGIGTASPTSKVEVIGDVLVSGIITATSFSGDGSGLTGVSAASTDNIQTATEAVFLSGVKISGVTTATGGIIGNLTGNSTTATTLQNARTIAGVSFDGSANISLNNNAITNGAGYITTSHGFTNTNQLTNGAGFITSSGTAALAQGLTGTPNITVNSVNSTHINSSGIITAASFSGDGSALTNVSVSSGTVPVQSRSGMVSIGVAVGIVTVFGRSSNVEVSVNL